MLQIKDKTIYFPIKYIPKNYQLEALDFIKKSILSGNRNILLNLPTGSGKSFIAVAMFANWYRNFINKNAKFDIVTNSKVLQDQYIKDFSFIRNLKGMSNYFCDRYDTDCSNGKEICRVLKTGHDCKECPYDIAKYQWINSDIGLTNFHMFDTLSLFQKGIINQRNSNVLIVDESQEFELIFSSYLGTSLSARSLKKCGFDQSELEEIDEKIKKIKTLDKYVKFIQSGLITNLEVKKDEFEQTLEKIGELKKKKELSSYVQNLQNKIRSYKSLFFAYNTNPDNIVLEIEINKKEKHYSGIELTTQLVWAFDHLNEHVWKHYDHIIFMSGTILDKEMFCYLNGLNPKTSTYYEIKSPFPLKNRPVYYLKIGKMSYDQKEETFKKQIPWVEKILKKYNSKGIIHTVNYEITNYIRDNILSDRFIFHETDNRDLMLERHINSKENTVLVSPSMMSGVDLKDNLARFQILMKIPYPSLASKKIVARKKAKPEFYVYKTVCDLIQSIGRGVRSETDYCDTFILDANLSDLLKHNSEMIPMYIQDAIKSLKIDK